MKRRCGDLLLALFFVWASFPTALAQANLTDSEIAKLLEIRVTYAKGGVGIVVGIMDEQGARVIAYGKPSKESTQTIDGDSVFEVGSISKVFTAILLADMIERGEVRLDDPVSKYLPASVTVPRRNGREITLKDLTTHSSGLPREPGNFVTTGFVLKRLITCPFCGFDDSLVPGLLERYSIEDMYEALSDFRLKRDIGSEFEYSNWGMALLGHALALRADTDYETLLKARITGPLQMNHTAVNLTPEMREHLAHGHDENGKPARNWDMPTYAGAGGVRSTANDLIKFMAVNLGLTEAPLSKAAQRSQELQFECCKEQRPIEMGMGWFREPQFEGQILSHGGSTGGYRTRIALDMGKRKGVIVLANSSIFIDDIAYHVLDNIQFPIANDPARRVAVRIDRERLKGYAGKYRLPSGEILTITAESERLFATRKGKKQAEIFAENTRDFFWKVPDAKASFKVNDVRATFVRNDKAEVTHLVLHQPGMRASAAKIE